MVASQLSLRWQTKKLSLGVYHGSGTQEHPGMARQRETGLGPHALFHDTARRVLQNCGQVFRYAIPSGWAERNPTSDFRLALTAVRQSHYATLTDQIKVGELCQALTR